MTENIYTSNPVTACIFDLDGVIVDTAKYHYEAWRMIAEHLGFEFTPEDNESMKGISRVDSLERLLEIGGIENGKLDKTVLCELKNTWYLRLISSLSKSELLPGINEYLHDLRSKSIKIALGSASKNARHILTALDISHQFDVIVDGNDVKFSKPDPEVFTKCADHLNSEASETIVFEDSQKGLDAAITGGFLTVGIGKASALSHADVVVPSLANENYDSIVRKLLIVHA